MNGTAFNQTNSFEDDNESTVRSSRMSMVGSALNKLNANEFNSRQGDACKEIDAPTFATSEADNVDPGRLTL